MLLQTENIRNYVSLNGSLSPTFKCKKSRIFFLESRIFSTEINFINILVKNIYQLQKIISIFFPSGIELF